MLETRKFSFKFKYVYLQAIGSVFLLLLAFLLLWHGNANANQAIPALVAQVYFDGDYRIADGQWQKITKGQHISSTNLILPKHDKAEAESFGINFWDRSKTLDDNMAYYEQAILEDAYEAAGSTTAVANMLGINQATASGKLNKYGISKKK
ncbi:MAG: hypothetical protein IKK17_04525 [Oscillospiraceae bacterium]|nr:hypothetical protein [Oscillospiraceae bacterium]